MFWRLFGDFHYSLLITFLSFALKVAVTWIQTMCIIFWLLLGCLFLWNLHGFIHIYQFGVFPLTYSLATFIQNSVRIILLFLQFFSIIQISEFSKSKVTTLGFRSVIASCHSECVFLRNVLPCGLLLNLAFRNVSYTRLRCNNLNRFCV